MACPVQWPVAASSWGAASLRRALSEAPSSAALAAAGSSCSPAAPRRLRLLPRRRRRRRTPTATRRSAPRRRRYRLLPALAPLLSVPSEPSSLVAKGEGRGGQVAANENMRCVPSIRAVRVQVGSLSAEWLAEERTRVVGTFPPRKRGWTGLVEKDTAGQTNIYSVEVRQP